MGNPYEILGLPRDATAAQIKAKFRRLAKKHHPDTGGDEAVFERLRAAYDVLIDDQRRAHFDATGEILEKVVDNEESAALTILMQALDHVLGVAAQRGMKPKNIDIVGDLRITLEDLKGKLAKERKQVEEAAEVWREMATRFSVKGGKQNQLAANMEYRAGQCAVMLAKTAEQERRHVRALEILADYEFRYDGSGRDPYGGFGAIAFLRG